VQAAVIFGVHHTYLAPGHKRSLYGRTLAWAICSVSSDNGRPLRPAPRAGGSARRHPRLLPPFPVGSWRATETPGNWLRFARNRALSIRTWTARSFVRAALTFTGLSIRRYCAWRSVSIVRHPWTGAPEGSLPGQSGRPPWARMGSTSPSRLKP
jgi:hypothetical protein